MWETGAFLAKKKKKKYIKKETHDLSSFLQQTWLN